MSTIGDPFSYDVESVAVHEFGHWLFLDNTENPGPVMYRYIAPGELRRALDQDDIEGLRTLYPTGGYGSEPPAGQCNNCRRILACTICEPCAQSAPTLSLGLHQKMIESLGSDLPVMLFRYPERGALLRSLLADLGELERIALLNKEEMENTWTPIISEWTPGLQWLSGSIAGENMVLTQSRAEALTHALDLTGRDASLSLRRDLTVFKAFIRSHRGRDLESMRAELFESRSGYQAGIRTSP